MSDIERTAEAHGALVAETLHRLRKAVRMLREEAAAVEQLTQDWTVEEVAQELRDIADKIERGDFS